MPERPRTQPWRTFWSPAEHPEKAGDAKPEIAFEKGKTVIISDSGGFTPKTYTQLYKADAVPNTTEIDQGIFIKK